MSGIKHFKRAEAKFEAFGDPPGQSGIARLVGPELSKTMGVGLAAFDGCARLLAGRRPAKCSTWRRRFGVLA
jgi:hypothetical protein